MTVDPGLRRLALRTLLAAFPGPSAPDWALDLTADGLAGFTLFGTNVPSVDDLERLTAQLRAVRSDVLVAIDEEGGDVTRLGHRTGSPYPGNSALGAVDDPELTHRVYAAMGHDLAAAGVNLDLAPTVDVNTAAENPIIGTRSFGADPALVARHSAAAVQGLQSAGVAACAKHFPGHGATVTDSHLELPTIDAPMTVLRERDLPPFAAAISAGTRAVMSAHIRVPALTGDGPATFSRAALEGLLRSTYGFEGVIVTDALEMRGAAGCLLYTSRQDLLCIGALVDHELVLAVADEIAGAVGEGRLDLVRLEQAAGRNAELASWAALARVTAVTAPVASPQLGILAARRALLVEGDPASLNDPLVVQLMSGHSIAEGKIPWGLRPFLGKAEQIDVNAAKISADELIERASGRPIVLVGRRVHQAAASRDLAGKLAIAWPTAVVEMGWPSSWRPDGARAFLVTHGASLASAQVAAEALGLHRS